MRHGQGNSPVGKNKNKQELIFGHGQILTYYQICHESHGFKALEFIDLLKVHVPLCPNDADAYRLMAEHTLDSL